MTGKSLTVLIIGIMGAAMFAGITLPEADGFEGSFGGGRGTIDDPYLIEDKWDLQAMNNKRYANYRLKNDIDASSTVFWNFGEGFKPIGTDHTEYFSGSLDGDNRNITGLYINRSGSDNIGLFGYFTGRVKNVNLIDFNISGDTNVGGLIGFSYFGEVQNSNSSGTVIGLDMIGGLVGYNAGTITGSSSSGNVTGSHQVGGLVGFNLDTIYDSKSSASVSGSIAVGGLVGTSQRIISGSLATGMVTGDEKVGGLVGFNYNSWLIYSCAKGHVSGKTGVGGLIGKDYRGKINNSYAVGDVSGDLDAGGLIGNCSEGNVRYCYSAGAVKGIANAGGLVGHSDLSTISDSYWDIDTSGLTGSYGGTGKTTSEMRSASTFTGWDLAEVWFIVEGITYPFLRWEDAEPPKADAGNDRSVTLDENGEAFVVLDGSNSADDHGILNFTWSSLSEIVRYGPKVEYVFRTPGERSIELTVYDHMGRSDTDTVTVLVIDDHSPVADPGPDRMVEEDSVVLFDGSASSDNVGITNWTWSFNEMELYGIGPSYIFEDPGLYEIVLKVADSSGNWDSAGMMLTVKDITRPVAKAVTERVVDEGTLVILDGSQSSDEVGIVSFTWSFVYDMAEVVLFGKTAEYMFDIPGQYNLMLNISDAAGLWNADTIPLTVMDITPPVADPGPDMTVDEGTLVEFDGSRSYDNAGIANYIWSFVYGGSGIVLYGISPSFDFILPGIYKINLNVSDHSGRSHIGSFEITVRDKTLPAARAGNDRTVPIGTVVELDGSLSTDNMMIKVHTWMFTYRNALIILEGEIVTFKFDESGVYVIFLTVIDMFDNSGFDIITITVSDTGSIRGKVIDDKGDPLSGAYVEIHASDGNYYNIITSTDGSFSMEIPKGPFSWKVSKTGFKTISDHSVLDTMEDMDLDIEINTDQTTHDEKDRISLLALSSTVIAGILFLLCIILIYLNFRKKGPGYEE